MSRLVFGLLLLAAPLATAIKVNWTPNGEAPLPFSQKAREAMGAAGQAAAAAAPPLSPVQLALAEVASAGGLVLVLMLVNLGEPFVLNDWIQPSTLKKLTSRVRELLASFSGGEREVVEAASSRAPRSKVVAASKAPSGKSEAAVRKARMERMAAASKAKAKAAAEAAASAGESAAAEEEV